jgi:arylsulfatase A-like enzyme
VVRWAGERGLRGALASLALALGCGTPAPDAPNVLLLSIDTLRPDYLSLNGYDRETTPFLDTLLGSGFYFERAVSPIGRTTPALAALLSGAYPHRSGVRTLNGTLAAGVIPLAEILRERGYQTAAVVTNQVLGRERGLARGFDVYDSAARRSDLGTTEKLLYYLEALDPTRPLFAWVHYLDPHVPYHPDREVAEGFDPDYDGPYRLHFGYEPPSGESPALWRAWPTDLGKPTATLENPLPARVNAHLRRLYAGEIRAADAAARAVVEGVRQSVGEPLLIVVTADHGESLGEHDYHYDHGDYVYNAGTRVPLGFVLPDGHPLRGSGRCADWVSLVDVVPTLLELLGFEPDPRLAAQLEGRSLVPCLRGEAPDPRPVYAESGRSWFPELVPGRIRNDVAGRFRSVTLGDWKLVWSPFQTPDREWELYRMSDDPHETRNLYRVGHPALPPLRQALGDWLARAPAQERAPPPLSERDRAALRELGYLP